MSTETLPRGAAGHLFEFSARDIAAAAEAEAKYHDERIAYWQAEYDQAVARVEETIGAKVVKHAVTDGYTVEVVVDYGDQDAYTRMQQAFRKINTHRQAAERHRSDASVYGSQDSRPYELTREDVRNYRLGSEPRED